LFLIVSWNVSGCPESVPLPDTWTLVAARVFVTALFPMLSALSAARGSPLAVALAEGEPPAVEAGELPAAADVFPVEADELPDELQPAAPAASTARRHAAAA
jgi:hypothetical protein